MVQADPLVSVIVVNHNGMEFIGSCIDSILKSDISEYEIIVVDNASSDVSLDKIEERLRKDSRISLIKNSRALGPAAGRNIGARRARGEFIIFLDNDTEVCPTFIREMLSPLISDLSIGAGQAKILRMGTNSYDCAGDYLGPLGFLVERSRGAADTGQFDYLCDILSAKSAASIIRKDLFQKIYGFDEDFFMYLEETDLSWRVWLSGKRVVFIPQAIVYHAFNTPRKDFKKYYSKYLVRYYGARNYISTLIKNLSFFGIIRYLPLHIAGWVTISVLFFLKGCFDDAFFILKGVWWNVLNLTLLISKRKRINRQIRKVKDSAILPKIAVSQSPKYFLEKITTYISLSLS